MSQPTTAGRGSRFQLLLFLIVPLAGLTWAYWTTLVEMASVWSHNPQYSHGYLVPGFALALLWFRRSLRPTFPLRPTWWGVLLLAAGIGLRLGGTFYFYPWCSNISLVPTLAGLCLMVGGWSAGRWAWPAIAFLTFMVPLPYTFSGRLTRPLQEIATVCSTFLLQTIGIPAINEGNLILLSESEIGVVEACSGLRMLVIFFALSTAVALLIRRPLWEKIVLVLSAIPIALASNIIRITATGILHETVNSEVANLVFHDLAGWLMMPLALAFLWMELQVLCRLWLEAASGSAARPTLTSLPPSSASPSRRPPRPWKRARVRPQAGGAG